MPSWLDPHVDDSCAEWREALEVLVAEIDDALA
jgi:hypothetical protein